MEFKHSSNRIWLENQDGKEIAFVSFPAKSAQSVDVVSTVVDPSLRGQGVAGALMEALAQELRRSGRKTCLTCSYAVKWFSQHPEHADLLEEP